MRGMKYLTDYKEGSGTLALRIMTNLDADGKERDETSVLALRNWKTGQNPMKRISTSIVTPSR